MTAHPDLSSFRNYLNKFVAMDDARWSVLTGLLHIRQFKKKELFLREGTRCLTVGFILKGCFQSVKTTDGTIRTFDFAFENEFITDYYSILKQTPSAFDVIAIEDSVVACIAAADLFSLFDNDTVWQKFGRLIAEQTCCYFQERLFSAFFDSPIVRYEKLLADAPDIILRIPQHIIANYLGVTKETLSRIRRKMIK